MPGELWLVDRWRIAEHRRETFAQTYRDHVADVIAELRGYRDSVLLVAGDDPTAPWQLEALFSFESDDILDRFHDDFAAAYAARFPGRTVGELLSELEPDVLAHEDTTMHGVER